MENGEFVRVRIWKKIRSAHISLEIARIRVKIVAFPSTSFAGIWSNRVLHIPCGYLLALTERFYFATLSMIVLWDLRMMPKVSLEW
jgi:hypothetical protein